MKYKSWLNDAQIAELLGLRLIGDPLNDLPATVKIGTFRETFESELEERLTESYNEMLNVVKRVAVNSVREDISSSIGNKSLRTKLYLDDSQVEVEEGNDKVTLYITVRGYIGKDGRGKATNHDVGHLGKLFVDSTTFSFDHADGLSIDRYGDVQVKPLDQRVQIAGKSLDSNHYFQVTYVAEVPKARLAEVYSKHIPATR